MIRAATDGGLVHLNDVARVEIGAENSATISRGNRMHSTDMAIGMAIGMAISLAPGANGLNTANAVEARLEELSRCFPEGVTDVIPHDTTPFVLIAIEEMVETLV